MPLPEGSRELDDLLAELRPALRSGIADLAECLLGRHNNVLSNRTEWRWGNHGSFRVVVSGPNRGACADFESDWKGDPLALIMRERGCKFIDAARWGAGWAGIATDGREATPGSPNARRQGEAEREHKRADAEAAQAAHNARRASAARQIWAEAAPVDGTLAAIYLVATRGIPRPAVGWPASIGFRKGAGSIVLSAIGSDGAEICIPLPAL